MKKPIYWLPLCFFDKIYVCLIINKLINDKGE